MRSTFYKVLEASPEDSSLDKALEASPEASRQKVEDSRMRQISRKFQRNYLLETSVG